MTSAVLLAVALWIGGLPVRLRLQRREPISTDAPCSRVGPARDPLAAASSLDVFALCLRAGMAVSSAAGAAAGSAPPDLARVLRRGAALLSLGADPAIAWSSPPELPAADIDPRALALLRLSRRSADSGAALAVGIGELADQYRRDAGHAATAAAERAGVLIAGPLGLCFLPAFICLGIIPVVAGLAHGVMQSGWFQ